MAAILQPVSRLVARLSGSGAQGHRLQLVRDTVLYGGASMVRYALSFILLPVYTRLLTQDQYAVLDLVIGATALLSIFMDAQLVQSANRFYHERAAHGEKRSFLGGMVVFRMWTALLMAGATAALAAGFGIGYTPPAPDGRALWIAAVLATPFAVLSELLFLYLRLLEMKRLYAIVSAANVLLAGGLSVILMTAGMGPMGFLIGQGCGNLLACIYLIVRLRNEMSFRWIPSSLRPLLLFSIPLVPAMILNWCWAWLSRFYMVHRLPLSDVALYGVAMKVLVLIGFLGMAFRSAWEPLSMKVLQERKGASSSWYSDVFGLYMSALLLLTCCVAAGAGVLTWLMAPPSYAGAAVLMPFLAISAGINFAANSLNIGNQVARKTWYWSIASLASAVVMFVVLIATIGRIGVMAAPVGIFAGSVVQVIIVYWASQLNFRVPYETSCIVAAVLGFASLALVHVCNLIGVLPPVASSLLMLVLGCFFAWRTLNAHDRRTILASIFARHEMVEP